jgi:hypothetical protein
MTITFETDNDVIVYALEKVIAYARRTQQIFVAQCVWWLASIIGLEQGLVNYIDNLQSRINVTVNPEKASSVGDTVSPIPRDIQEDQRQDKLLEECEEYLEDSKRLREIAALKASGKSLTGCINPTAISKRRIRKKNRNTRRREEPLKKDSPKIAGIATAEIRRRRETGECLRCAWPADRKGAHQVASCRRPIRLDKGTASFPKAKEHSRIKQPLQQPAAEEDSSEDTGSDESSDDSL